MTENIVTVRVPMNIAFVKYWGKRDEEKIIPLNDSISMTVDALVAETTIELVNDGEKTHTVEINGKDVDLNTNNRYERVFNEALRLRRKREHSTENGGNENNHSIVLRFKVKSNTNFPVAAGLASSAAGFAAISFGIQKLLDLDDIQANKLARIGSGSACRSMFGGLVHWKKGESEDGSDCFAVQDSEEIWQDLYCIIFVFSDSRKKIGSSEGMKLTAKTSELLKHRIEHCVDERIEGISKAYKDRNFDEMARIIMVDSNQFHAVCLDTSPPIRYMNDSSWLLIDLVEEFNRLGTENVRRAAYTFDAGPNACVIVEEKNLLDFLLHSTASISVPFTDLSTISRAFKTAPNFFNKSASDGECIANRLIVSKMGGPPTIV